MPQRPYSLDLAPADNFLVPQLKMPMEGKQFATIEEIKEKSNMSCWRHPKPHFISVLRIGKKLWHICVIEVAVV